MDDVRLANFIILVKNINKAIGQGVVFADEINEDMRDIIGTTEDEETDSPFTRDFHETAREMRRDLTWGGGSATPLQRIYNYDECNIYAKTIMEISKYSFDNLNNAAGGLFDADEGNLREFVQFCRKSENVIDGYKFIFWALMILTVDKRDAEKRLSLICDYTKMLNITDDEFEDIIRIIKFIYNQDKLKKFKSETIPIVFERLFMDKEVENSLKIVHIGAYPDNYLNTDKTIFKSVLPPNGMDNAKNNYDKAKEELKRLNYNIDWNLVPNNNLLKKIK